MPQSLAKIYIHLVFSTKNRAPIIEKTWIEELFSILGGTVNNLGCQSMIVGGTSDHIHMLFQLSKTRTLADVTNKIKSTSSKWVKTHLKKDDFYWQLGYAAFSVSQVNIEALRQYIQNQEKHHTKLSFQDELRDLLTKFGIEWDEKYLWD